jgi:hypothetical protein
LFENTTFSVIQGSFYGFGGFTGFGTGVPTGWFSWARLIAMNSAAVIKPEFNKSVASFNGSCAVG